VLGLELPHLSDSSRPGFRRRDVTHAGRVTFSDTGRDSRRNTRPRQQPKPSRRLNTDAAGDSTAGGIPNTKGDPDTTAAVNRSVIDSLHTSQRRNDNRFWF
jgi:hypothetical protein